MNINEKLSSLRNVMREKSINAYIINGTDPHLSEYVSERWQSRAFISGFTGSAGTVVVTEDSAIIWTDSRYFIQCEEQIKGSEFVMKKLNGMGAEKISTYLKCYSEKLSENAVIGISAETITIDELKDYEKDGVTITPTEDLLNYIWTTRPEVPSFPVCKLSDKLCGESVKSKLSMIRENLKKVGAQCTLISSLDDIAWTLNLRGSDIKDCPVFISYLYVDNDKAVLYTARERFKKINTDNLLFEIKDYSLIDEDISMLRNSTIYLNPKKTNMLIYSKIDKESMKVLFGDDFTTIPKACKNKAEIEGMINAHIEDGTALVNFLSEVYERVNDPSYAEHPFTEISLASLLSEKRKQCKNYLGPSFETICAYKEHGAIVHYSATEKTDKKITGKGLLVLDSGGQYSMGTTDITRTLLFGTPTKEQRVDYTLVLKGHLALSRQIFPEGTNGHQLDVLAHMFLWNNSLNFFHGTGHGVGCRLNVHEGPQRISSHASSSGTELKVGMVISNEPGVYKENKHGIRIENLIYVSEYEENEFSKFLKFNTLTCCPYEKKLIVKELLTEEELKQLNSYHLYVYKTLKPLVDKKSVPYLTEATLPIK